jgi:hypothetical protein
MKKLNKFLLLLIAVSSFSVLSATENPLKNSAKVFGIASHKTLNDEMKPIAQMVFDARSARSQFQIQSPFKVSRVNETFDGGLKQSAILQLQRESLENILTEKPEHMELQLQDAAGNLWKVDLIQSRSVTNDFVVRTSDSDEDIYVDEALFYRGVVKGDYNSVAAFTVYNGHIVGMISSGLGNMVLHPMEDEEGSFVFYNDVDLTSNIPFECKADELDWVGESDSNDEGINSRALSDCVRVYIECDYALYQNKGSNVTNVVNWITAVYNNVATLYANESINTAISEVFVWTSADSYSKTNASTALTQFRNLRTTFNGDLAHLAALGGNNLGGVAWVNAMCTTYKYAYSNIASTYQNVPTYSWTVMVMTHEMGHNLGSNHTQWCGWSGGALDNCYTTEGGCAPGPAPVGGGTIMSYCHLTSYGINLANGFGTQPGNLIRSRVSSVTCLSASCTGGGGGTCGVATGLVTSNITTTTASAGWNAVSGATSYNFQYKLASSGTWSQINVAGTAVNFTSLTPGTSYNWRVQALCGSNTGSYSSTITFTTQSNGVSYCASAGQNATYEWVRRVKIGTIDRSSNSDGGYYNGTSLSTNLRRGVSHTITYRAGFNGSGTRYWRVWLDNNGDGDFTDAGEMVVSRSSSSSNNLSSSFTIPATATLGTTRIRVQVKWESYPTSCETFPYGEVEDYTVNITNTAGLPAEGGSDLVMTEVKLFPNPVNEDLNISFISGTEGEVEVQVFDLLGKLQLEQGFNSQPGENLMSIQVNPLLAGPYVLIIKDNDQIMNYRFIKAD